ncbi:MAG: DNA polymerase III subunit beta [Desulfuromonas sp.]|nr:MAG: DNA polymerase III subunit beta [Desulfuromonas sp.]
MHFQISKDQIIRGLSKIQGIVDKKSTIPILSNVLIETEDENKLSLIATDLEVGMKVVIDAEIITPGKITISAKKLFEIIRELPEQPININVRENSWVEIKCGKAVFNIVGLAAEEYPYFPNLQDIDYFNVDSEIIKKMIEKTSFSMSNDEKKYNLNGLYLVKLNIDGSNYIRFVATDAHRLALIQEEIEIPNIDNLSKGVILPRKGVIEFKKLSEDGDSQLNIGFSENNVIVNKENSTIIMRLVDGDFPDYERVIPLNNQSIAVANVDKLLHALKRISTLSSEKTRGIKIELSNGKLEISSSNPELGEAREDLEVEYTGDKIEIGFNSKYLMDILTAQDHDFIEFILKDNISSGMVRPENSNNYTCVLMPMRL